MRGSEAAKEISVDITGVKVLELSATDGGDGTGYDHADWANAFVTAVPR